MVELFMSDKLGRVWREAVRDYFKSLVRNLPSGTERNHENILRVAVFPPRFEHGSPEYASVTSNI
jgi:hypothetical protein